MWDYLQLSLDLKHWLLPNLVTTSKAGSRQEIRVNRNVFQGLIINRALITFTVPIQNSVVNQNHTNNEF